MGLLLLSRLRLTPEKHGHMISVNFPPIIAIYCSIAIWPARSLTVSAVYPAIIIFGIPAFTVSAPQGYLDVFTSPMLLYPPHLLWGFYSLEGEKSTTVLRSNNQDTERSYFILFCVNYSIKGGVISAQFLPCVSKQQDKGDYLTNQRAGDSTPNTNRVH